MGDSLDMQVKSASRVIKLFEWFSEHRQPGRVVDIAEALGIPHSSASKLLACLESLGYIQRARDTRMYSPTARLSLLGNWIQPAHFQGRLLELVDHLHASTGKAIVLAMLSGLDIIHIHVSGDQLPERLRSGTRHAPSMSPFGKALLAKRSKLRTLEFVEDSFARWPNERVSNEALLWELELIRHYGYSLCINRKGDGVGILGMAVPVSGLEDNLALGMIGDATDMLDRHEVYADEISRLLHEIVRAQDEGDGWSIAPFQTNPSKMSGRREETWCSSNYAPSELDSPADAHAF